MELLIAAAVVVLVIVLAICWLLSVTGSVLILLLKIGAGIFVAAFIAAMVWAVLDPEGLKKAQAEADAKRHLKNEPAERAKREWNARPKP